jgi:hypothetical protein
VDDGNVRGGRVGAKRALDVGGHDGLVFGVVDSCHAVGWQ